MSAGEVGEHTNSGNPTRIGIAYTFVWHCYLLVIVSHYTDWHGLEVHKREVHRPPYAPTPHTQESSPTYPHLSFTRQCTSFFIFFFFTQPDLTSRFIRHHHLISLKICHSITSRGVFPYDVTPEADISWQFPSIWWQQCSLSGQDDMLKSISEYQSQ